MNRPGIGSVSISGPSRVTRESSTIASSVTPSAAVAPRAAAYSTLAASWFWTGKL